MIIYDIYRIPRLDKKFFFVVIISALILNSSSLLFYHLIPFIPFITRGLTCLKYKNLMNNILSEAERDRETIRTIVLTLLGISFTGLLALTIVDAKVDLKTFYPMYYMLLSFLGLFVTLNLQSYKFYRWHSILGVTLIDFATLSLLLAITSIIWSSNQNILHQLLFTVLAIGTWAGDHLKRLDLLTLDLKNEFSGLLENTEVIENVTPEELRLSITMVRKSIREDGND